jgi:hypothetical protein
MQDKSATDVFADILDTCWRIARFDEKDTSLEMTELKKGLVTESKKLNKLVQTCTF